jgi:hypothetical protein
MYIDFTFYIFKNLILYILIHNNTYIYNIMATTIRLNASELAVITGHNKYQDINELTEKILIRNRLKKGEIIRTDIQKNLVKIQDKQILQTIKKELKLPEQSTKKDIEKKINTMCIAPQLDKQTEQESHISLHKILEQTPIVKKLLEKSAYSDLIKARGTHKEDSSLNHSEKKNKLVIQKRNNRLYTRVLYLDDICRIIVQGKIDGMIGTDTVVESKNRSKRLFYKIPIYEKVQLEAYLYLTQTKKALHIENYNEMTNEQYYDHDKLFWDECSEKLITYVTQKLLSM